VEEFVEEIVERVFPTNQRLIDKICDLVQEDPEPEMKEIDGADLIDMTLEDMVYSAMDFGGVYQGLDWDGLTFNGKRVRALTLLFTELLARYAQTIRPEH
jgi:hypothetical protein